MGVRFNKRITILPWLKANVGKSGISLSIGPKGKTLNIGSTGVNVNVSLGKGMGYSKRLITWKKLNLLSILGLGGAAAAKKVSKSKSKTKTTGVAKKGKKGSTTVTELSLDDALTEAETDEQLQTQQGTPEEGQLEEQPGCGPLGCIIGALVTLIILALIAVIVYLIVTRPAA